MSSVPQSRFGPKPDMAFHHQDTKSPRTVRNRMIGPHRLGEIWKAGVSLSDWRSWRFHVGIRVRCLTSRKFKVDLPSVFRSVLSIRDSSESRLFGRTVRSRAFKIADPTLNLLIVSKEM